MAMAHTSVLLKETIDALNLRPGMTVVDGTLGGGGHSEAILEKITPGGRLVGIDKDEYAINVSKERLKEFSGNTVYVHDDFKHIKEILCMLNIDGIDGAVIDLGVSSFQLDQCMRGFSYNLDSRLDMRMNIKDKTCAADIVNSYAQEDLERILRDYGEERWAARIAEFIVRERSDRPIITTGHLVEVIKKAVPSGARRDGPHPARRSFQALRIEVNGELDALREALFGFVQALENKARIAVITFHSLEDRIVKQEFRRFADPCECPKSFPVCVCGKVSMGKVITKKPVLPSITEVEQNSRARSAKLRIFEARR
ncbi:MAG: 16S rRNA (cytosine(1402)-N(4))-methyltransferase RsmH [Eubacteriales bacterium]|nr:16S rRNA (cytosine(1402)-N(4))-methyltransferase RsmH [Eubacteriales bacterium]